MSKRGLSMIAFFVLCTSIVTAKLLLDRYKTQCLELWAGGQYLNSGNDTSSRFFGTIKNTCSRTILNPQIRVHMYADETKRHLLDNSHIFKLAGKIAPYG